MSRLETKCVIGSATFHGLLLVVFLCASAFMRDKHDPLKDMGPVVTFSKAIVTDGANSGGNPNARQQVTPLAPQPPKPEPPKPEPPKPEPPKPEPKKEQVVKTPTPEVKKDVQKDTSKTKLTSVPTIRRSNEIAIARQKAEAAAAAAADLKRKEELARLNAEKRRIADAVNDIVGSTSSGLNKGTVVDTAGPGGEAFVNYGSWVRDVYERAWQVSPELTDDDASALAKVTIRRDGTVASANISQRSSNTSLNKSVQRALDTVKTIGKSFPAGAKESERTFTIEFNLKTRRGIG